MGMLMVLVGMVWRRDWSGDGGLVYEGGRGRVGGGVGGESGGWVRRAVGKSGWGECEQRDRVSLAFNIAKIPNMFNLVTCTQLSCLDIDVSAVSTALALLDAQAFSTPSVRQLSAISIHH